MIHHFLTKQFLGFLAVGGTAAFLHWLARIVLSHWLSFAMAVLLSYGVGMLVAFILNRLFIFPTSNKPMATQARDFVMVNLPFLPVVWLASILLERGLRALGMVLYTQALAHAMAVAIPMLATFLLYKFFAFKEVSPKAPPP